MSNTSSNVSVVIGDKSISITRNGNRSHTVANILAIENNKEGKKVVYLDRLVHRVGEDNFCGWIVSGAISSILTEV